MRQSTMAVAVAVAVAIIVAPAYGQTPDEEAWSDTLHAQAAGKAVNVNDATAEQLAYLPGIGQKTDDNILYAREQGIRFETVEDLQQVSGIGQKTADKLAPYVIFDGPTTATSKIGSTAKKTTGKKIARPTE